MPSLAQSSWEAPDLGTGAPPREGQVAEVAQGHWLPFEPNENLTVISVINFGLFLISVFIYLFFLVLGIELKTRACTGQITYATEPNPRP